MDPLVTSIPGCLPCDIVAGRQAEPGGVIYEDAYWHVGSAVAPSVWKGFLVIKSKRHCEQIAGLTPEEAAALGPVIHLTCQALTEVLKPAKVFICSFGDGIQHIHFWALPRMPDMNPGMHAVLFDLDRRLTLSRSFGLKKWLLPDEEVTATADALRECFKKYG